MNSPSPSPLVPQGAIPPKNTSRSQRVLVIAVMVVLLHVGGLGLVLLQGCQKDANKNTASNSSTGADTNSTPAMSYPTPDTNTPSMFASATNNTATNTALGARPGTNATVPNSMIGGGLPGLPASNVAGGTAPSDIPPLPGTGAGVTPIATGAETDYKIQKGDTLSSIATRNKVTLGALLKANPTLDPKKLKVGQPIKVPAPAPTSTASATPGTSSVPPTGATFEAGAATSTTLYTVKAGDTLTKIAKTHGITVNQLRAANGMKTTQVQVGKKLKIPAAQKTAAAATNTTRH